GQVLGDGQLLDVAAVLEQRAAAEVGEGADDAVGDPPHGGGVPGGEGGGELLVDLGQVGGEEADEHRQQVAATAETGEQFGLVDLHRRRRMHTSIFEDLDARRKPTGRAEARRCPVRGCLRGEGGASSTGAAALTRSSACYAVASELSR